MSNLIIEPLPVIAPFLVTLPDGTIRKDSLVMTKSELQQTSQAEFKEIAAAKTEDYLAALASIQDAQAVRDVEELIVQVEEIANLADPAWVDVLFEPGTQARYVLDILIQRQTIARPMIEQATPPAVPRSEGTYGDLWQRWLTLLD